LTEEINKISVLYVDQAVAFGGSLIVVGHIIDSLDKSKFRPVVVAELDKSIIQNHIKLDVPLHIIRCRYNYRDWMKTTRIVRKIPGKYLRKVITYILSGVRSLVNLPYALALVKVILQEKIDLIHVNNGMDNIGPILISILLRRRFVVHSHGIEAMGTLERLVVNKVPKFIVISKFIKEELIASNFPEHRIVVVPNPVNPRDVGLCEINTLLEKYNIHESELIFGIVGRIVRWKGHVEFLEAAKLVLQALPNTKALIVGDTSDGDDKYTECIKNSIDELGIKNRVIFTGYVSDVSAFYKTMDVCVHCSIEPEPFGLVITEAMSYGVPVIASSLGAPKEIISDGKNGFIVEPRSTARMAELILNLLTDRELRENIGRSGKEHVEKNYDLETYGRSIEKIYFGVLEDSR